MPFNFPNPKNPMDDTIKNIFAPLDRMLKSQELSDADLLEFAGQYATVNAYITQSILFHARDYIIETCHNAISYSQIISEVYRRTFFDPVQRAKYLPEEFHMDSSQLRQFVKNMVEQGRMAALQESKGSQFIAPERHQ